MRLPFRQRKPLRLKPRRRLYFFPWVRGHDYSGWYFTLGRWEYLLGWHGLIANLRKPAPEGCRVKRCWRDAYFRHDQPWPAMVVYCDKHYRWAVDRWRRMGW